MTATVLMRQNKCSSWDKHQQNQLNQPLVLIGPQVWTTKHKYCKINLLLIKAAMLKIKTGT